MIFYYKQTIRNELSNLLEVFLCGSRYHTHVHIILEKKRMARSRRATSFPKFFTKDEKHVQQVVSLKIYIIICVL